MEPFDTTRRQLSQYHLCLERDLLRGLIAPSAGAEVEECYRTLGRLLERARVELEGADPARVSVVDFRLQFVARWAMIGRCMFRAMYEIADSEDLRREARVLRAEAGRVMEHLCARLGHAA